MYVTGMGRGEGYTGFGGDTWGKRPLSRPRRTWDGIIQIDLQELFCGRMDCIGLGQDREMGKLGRKRTLSRPRRKWDGINEIDLQEIGCWCMDSIGRVRIWK